MATSESPSPLLHRRRNDPRLDRDADSLRETISELIRVYQFRDRERAGCHDLSVTQYHALDIIADEPVSMNELAARLFLDKSTTSRVIDALERKSLAERRPDPTDRRALRLNPTDEGRRVLNEIRKECLAEDRNLLNEFEPAVRREMARLIGKLSRAAAARVDTSGGTCQSIG